MYLAAYRRYSGVREMQINLGSALAGAAQLFLTPATAQFGCGSLVLQSRCSLKGTKGVEAC